MPSTNYLVDTNVLSELVRRQPDAGVLEWAQTVRAVAVSVVTVEEVYFGLSWKPNPRILEWFEDFLESQCEVLAITAAIAKRCGEMRGKLQGRGQTRTSADLLIAATAYEHQLTLVTRNVRDFADCGLSLLDPFRG